MPATTAYSAGFEANAAQLSYAPETTWGSPPPAGFKTIRFTAETLTGTKTRARPQEISANRESAAAVTTQESAGGNIEFALSYATFDDFLASALGADWQAPQVIAGVAADITLTAGTKALTSTTANKFQNINAGQVIRLLGFTNAANNGFFKVATKVNAMSLTLASPAAVVTETPGGTAAQVRASALTNSTLFKSLFIQEQFAPNLFLQYPGSYVSAFTISGGMGQFLSGSFTIIAQAQTKSTTLAGPAPAPAPSGRVNDPVGNFVGVWWNNAAVAAVVESFSITATNDGAAADYGMGSAAAAGVRGGMLLASGKIKMFFKDSVYFDLFRAETSGALDIITKDSDGNAYVIGLTNANLMNPQIHAGGVNQPVMAEFDIEGNPAAGGGTIRIDRLPAV